MKFSHRPFFLVSVLTLAGWTSPLHAQDAGSTDTPSPESPTGSTVITSDELRMDQDSHTAVFSGTVTVVGTNFKLTCQEMSVSFTKDSKVDYIVAKGDVVIIQPGRITHSGQAQYFHDEDKFVLTDQPTILDNGNQIAAPKITIFRTKGELQTEGGRSTVTIPPGHGVDSNPATPSDSTVK